MEIKRAYRRLSLRLHPDKQRTPGAASAAASAAAPTPTVGASDEPSFASVAEAYEALRDADRRRWYDLYGARLSEQIARQAGEQAGTVCVRDESKVVARVALCVVACAALVLVKRFVRPDYTFPLEWVLYTVLAHFLMKRPLDVKAAALPALASLLVFSTAQLPVVVTLAWWLYAGLATGAASGVLDQSVYAALLAGAAMALFGVGQLPLEWTVTGVLFDLYGRIVLGSALVAAIGVWITEVEPLAAWHRDDAHSSVLSLVTSLGIGGVPAGVPIAAFSWLVLWRVDGWLDARVEYFLAAVLLTVLSVHSAAFQPRAPRGYRLAAVAAVASVAYVYAYEDVPLAARLALQATAAGMLHFLEVAIVFGVGETPAAVETAAPTAQVAPERCRAIVFVWLAQVFASLFLHPVTLTSGSWHLGAMLLVLCGLLPLGVQPLPQLIKCAVLNIPLTFYNDAVDDDDDDGDEDNGSGGGNGAQAGDDGPLDGEDEAAYRLRRMIKSSAAALGTAPVDDANDSEKAFEFFETLQMAKAELMFKERVRLNEAHAAAVDDDSFEVSFDSWSTVRQQISNAPPPKPIAQGGATPSAADMPIDNASNSTAASSDATDSSERECFVCHRVTTVGLKRCGACLSSLYCSIECQKRDWNGHKDACRQMQHILKLEQRFHSDRAGLMRDAMKAQLEREQEMRAQQAAAAQQRQQQALPDDSHQHHGHSHSHGDDHFH